VQVVDTLPSGPDPEKCLCRTTDGKCFRYNEKDNTRHNYRLRKRVRLGAVQVA